jgi:O-methyltransferase involved in polyketide biosynthesis
MKQDYGKISHTAILVARVRARYTDMPYAAKIYDEIKRGSRPEFFARLTAILRRLSGVAPNLNRIAFFESRYTSVNAILKSLGNDYAVIEVAAGLSARGLEPFLENSLYIETDLPEMLSTKQSVFQRVLQQSGKVQGGRHHFYPLNALNYNEWEGLGNKFFAGKQAKIAVVHEGLAPYLSREEKDRLRDNIKRFFSAFASKGAWITPDFYPYSSAQKTGIARLMEQRIERRTGRKYSRFSGLEEVREYVIQAGFQAEFVDSASIIDQLTCISKLNLDKETIRRALHRFKVSVARYEAGA